MRETHHSSSWIGLICALALIDCSAEKISEADRTADAGPGGGNTSLDSPDVGLHFGLDAANSLSADLGADENAPDAASSAVDVHTDNDVEAQTEDDAGGVSPGPADSGTPTLQCNLGSCYTGPAGTAQYSPCTEGELCTDGTCKGEVLPQQEVCGNGIDEDCSGADLPCPRTRCTCSWEGGAPTSGDFVKVYVALVNRSPDLPGLSWYSTQGYSPQTIARFAAASEVQNSLFPPGASDVTGHLIETIYENAFNREADAGGLAYWKGQFASGIYAHTGEKFGKFVMDFLAAAGGSDKFALNDRVEVAQYWTTQLRDNQCPWDEFGRTVLATVDGQSGAAPAKGNIDTRVAWMQEQTWEDPSPDCR